MCISFTIGGHISGLVVGWKEVKQ